jgi:hypothetical protein
MNHSEGNATRHEKFTRHQQTEKKWGQRRTGEQAARSHYQRVHFIQSQTDIAGVLSLTSHSAAYLGGRIP